MAAFEQVRKPIPDVWLVMVGDGPLRGEGRARARALGLEHQVFLAGARPDAEVADRINASDVFVLVSYNEGLPNVVPEAMACGRPVIATDVGGVTEAVEDGLSGVIVPTGSVTSLEGALSFLCQSPHKRKIMGKAARHRVSRHFTWSRTANELVAGYHRALGLSPPH